MKLVLIPGLAATSAMYGPEFDGLAAEVVRLDWPEHGGEASIAAMAERLLDEHRLDDADVIAGSSLGGMVGAEIAERAPPRALVLIGSARRPGEVNSLLRQVAKLRDVLPLEHLRNLVGLDFFSGRAPVLEMLAAADPAQVRALCGAIFAWDGRPRPACPSPRIHGAWDLVIPPPTEGVTIVPRAGHMLAMTHGERVAGFLRGVLEGLR